MTITPKQQLGPTQARVHGLHALGLTPPEMSRELGVTPARVYAVHRAIGLVPHKDAAPSRPPAVQARAERQRSVAARRAALAVYWRDHPHATADDAAVALGIGIDTARSDRRIIGLSIRRDGDDTAAHRLNADGVSVPDIARRLGRSANDIRKVLAGGGATDTAATSAASLSK